MGRGGDKKIINKHCYIQTGDEFKEKNTIKCVSKVLGHQEPPDQLVSGCLGIKVSETVLEISTILPIDMLSVSSGERCPPVRFKISHCLVTTIAVA